LLWSRLEAGYAQQRAQPGLFGSLWIL
jgi:hypothetical protein